MTECSAIVWPQCWDTFSSEAHFVFFKNTSYTVKSLYNSFFAFLVMDEGESRSRLCYFCQSPGPQFSQPIKSRQSPERQVSKIWICDSCKGLVIYYIALLIKVCMKNTEICKTSLPNLINDSRKSKIWLNAKRKRRIGIKIWENARIYKIRTSFD